ncbi:hypothetical protein BH23CYA1_BH23CYA1_22260 [soil metagenome]
MSHLACCYAKVLPALLYSSQVTDAIFPVVYLPSTLSRVRLVRTHAALLVSFSGVDQTVAQAIHTRHTDYTGDILRPFTKWNSLAIYKVILSMALTDF